MIVTTSATMDLVTIFSKEAWIVPIKPDHVANLILQEFSDLFHNKYGLFQLVSFKQGNISLTWLKPWLSISRVVQNYMKPTKNGFTRFNVLVLVIFHTHQKKSKYESDSKSKRILWEITKNRSLIILGRDIDLI